MYRINIVWVIVACMLLSSTSCIIAENNSDIILKALTGGSPEEVIKRQIKDLPNLIDCGDFEEKEDTIHALWSKYGRSYNVDQEVFHSGKASIRCDFDLKQEFAERLNGAIQTISGSEFADQKLPFTLAVTGWGKAGKVDSAQFNIYLDVFFDDETRDVWVVGFENGTHDWEFAYKKFEVKKKIKYIITNLIFRWGYGGIGWFDDIKMCVLDESSEVSKTFEGYQVEELLYKKTSEEVHLYDTTTEDKLNLRIDSCGNIKDIKFNNEKMFKTFQTNISGFAVRDIATGNDICLFDMKKTDDFKFTGNNENLKLELKAKFETRENRIIVSGEIRSLENKPRALTLYYLIPIESDGLVWWDSPKKSRDIREKIEYVNGNTAQTLGLCSRYPISVISKQGANLTLGVPLDRPNIVRMVYNNNLRAYYIAYDFGLSDKTKKPLSANFEFMIYYSQGDPDYAFRVSLKKYYDMYPHFFVRRVEREGIWMPFTPISTVEGFEDFGFAFQEGLRAFAFNKEHGIYNLPYSWLQCVWPHYGWHTLSQSGIYTKPGKEGEENLQNILSANPEKNPYEVNCDWRIPGGYGEYLLTVEKSEYNDVKKQGTELDGTYFDGVDQFTQANFREDHFKYTDNNLSFDYKYKLPVLVGSFCEYEFVKMVAEDYRKRNMFVMANGIPGIFMFSSPYIDIGGAEIGGLIDADYALLARSLLYKKPYGTLIKLDWNRENGMSNMDRYMKRDLFYGIYPSAFDTFGGGGKGNYWENHDWYNSGRPLFKKYVPLIKTINKGGWEPVTYAKTNSSDIWIERFGNEIEEGLYFTIMNTLNEEKQAQLKVDVKSLNIDNKNLKAHDMFSRQNLKSYIDNEGYFNIQTTLASNDVGIIRMDSGDRIKTGIEGLSDWLVIEPSGDKNVIKGKQCEYWFKIHNIGREVIKNIKARVSFSAWGMKEIEIPEINEIRPNIPITLSYKMGTPEDAKIREVNFITLTILNEKNEKIEGLIALTVGRPFDTNLLWSSETKQGREADTGDVSIFSKTEGIEVMTVNIKNNETEDLKGVLKLQIPKGWISNPETLNIDLSAKKNADYDFTIKYPKNENKGRFLIGGDLIIQGVEALIEPILIRIGKNKLMERGISKIDVDSSFEKYSIIPLNDGVVDTAGISWDKAAWASGENKNAHWIEIEFSEETGIHEIDIFWNYEHYYYSSKTMVIQISKNGEWIPIKEVYNEVDQVGYNKIEIPETKVKKIRILQPSGQGHALRPDLMWVREVEIY